MDDSQMTNLEQIRALVDVNSAVRFAGQRREEIYTWVERTLVRHEYAGLRKPDKGVLRLYLAQMTGLSRAQATRHCLQPRANAESDIPGSSIRVGPGRIVF
jgi:hypothetical protein